MTSSPETGVTQDWQSALNRRGKQTRQPTVPDVPWRCHLRLSVKLLREGGSLPGPETGLLSNTQKWIVRGDICADKARDFTGKGHPGGEQEDKGTQENSPAVSGFMGMGLVSRLFLANHPDSESFLVVHALFSQDGCQQEGFWEIVQHVASPFDLCWTLPVGGGLLVPCSLPRPLVVKKKKNSCKCLLRCLDRVGSFSQCASPKIICN